MKRFSLLLSLLLCCRLFAGESAKFELVDGDRVTFVGGGFIEREQEEGYIETMLTRAYAGRNVTFRNLGWSGDTVHSFLSPNLEPRPKYVPTPFDYVAKLKPTVIFVSYGMMEAFDGEAGLPQFIKDYNTVLDKLSATTKRIVIISPFRHEKLGGTWADPAEHNRNLKLYVDALQKLATQRGLQFVNLFDRLPVGGRHPITVNGVHLSNDGYAKAAALIAKELDIKVSSSKFTQDDSLREAIKDKNKQWWYHYRPMNSEYVYPSGERYQVKIGPVDFPLYTEIEEFAKLAEDGDKKIATLRQKAAHGDSLAPPQKNLSISRPIQPDTNAPDPAVEKQTFKVADGFEVNLFAADPLIEKPVQMAFDERGRLWVASTTLYPQIRPGQKQTDKIIILEDTNGDGRADKTTVFADNLLIPTAILPSKGGAYVFEDTKLLFLPDKNGDGHADETQVVLSGFGTEDSHHKGHVLRWGPEGNFYFNAGVFLHNTIETANGIVNVAGHWLAGIFEYRPENGKLDVHLASCIAPNPWGHYWNYWGSDFVIDSSGQAGSNFILPTSGRSSTAVQVTGGQGKLAGAEIISGRHFPDDWQGNLIANPFKENRVSRWKFSDDSSGFALTPLAPLIESTDNSFRPVEVRMGPDGALYILDWYNPLIGHMQYHFRDPGRDRSHGRIWRVTAKNRALVPRPKFVGASVNDVLESLKAPEGYTRYEAKRVLAERNPKQVLPALAKWVKNLNPAYPEYDHYRLEALWTYQNLNVVETNLLQSLLHAKEPDARAAATDVIRHWHAQLQDPVALLARQVADSNPRVRLRAVIALSYINYPHAVEIATRALDSTMDRYLDEALKDTVNALKPVWLPALQSGALTFDDNVTHLEYVLHSAGSKDAVKPYAKLLHEQKLRGADLENAITLIATYGEAEDLANLYSATIPLNSQARLATELSRAARDRKVIPKVDTARLKEWLASSDENLRMAALRLAGAWKEASLREAIVSAATSSSLSSAIREAAIDGLSAMDDDATLKDLQQLTGPNNSLPIRFAAVEGLTARNLQIAALAAADVLRNDLAGNDPSPLLKAFLTHKNGGEMLGQALSAANINADNAKLALRSVQTSGQQSPALIKALTDASGIAAETKQLSREELLQWVEDVKTKGDPARGEKIFHRTEINCFKCHAIDGAGGQVGPDLGAVGGGSQIDYLIESVLYPNKVIKDGFETVEVTTKDDDYYLGIRVRENKDELVLKDADHSQLVVPQSKIRQKKNKPVSLMPSGLTATLTHPEFIDLVRFLSELGRPGPYANDPRPIVRRWRVQDGSSTNWIPAYADVSGNFIPVTASGKRVTAVRCDVEVTTPGKIDLKLNTVDGLKLVVDKTLTPLEQSVTLDLSRGVHALKFKVDASRKEPLRVEFAEVPGSPGRFQVVGGP